MTCKAFETNPSANGPPEEDYKSPDYKAMYFELQKVAKSSVEASEGYLNSSRLVDAIRVLERLRFTIQKLDRSEAQRRSGKEYDDPKQNKTFQR